MRVIERVGTAVSNRRRPQVSRTPRSTLRGAIVASAALLLLVSACDDNESDLGQWAGEVCEVAQSLTDAIEDAAGPAADLGDGDAFELLDAQALASLSRAARDAEQAMGSIRAPLETQSYTDTLAAELGASADLWGRRAISMATNQPASEDQELATLVEAADKARDRVAAEWVALSAFAQAEIADEEHCGALIGN